MVSVLRTPQYHSIHSNNSHLQTLQSYICSSTGITPTTVDYNSTTGWMTVTKNGHGLVEGDYIKVDQESIVFTCAQDGNN